MKNSNDTIGNRTRGLPACSAVCLIPRMAGDSQTFFPIRLKTNNRLADNGDPFHWFVLAIELRYRAAM